MKPKPVVFPAISLVIFSIISHANIKKGDPRIMAMFIILLRTPGSTKFLSNNEIIICPQIE